MLVGRDFDARDTQDALSVEIVNETFVERYFARGNALGRELRLRGSDEPATAIVGVLAASRTNSANDLSQPAEPEVYVPLWPQRAFSKHLVVRSSASAETVAAQVRQALREVAPTAAVESPRTLDEIRGESIATRSFAMQLLADDDRR